MWAEHGDISHVRQHRFGKVLAEADDHAYLRRFYRQVTKISTDGFAGYPEAVDLAFGPYAKFGTIVKGYRNATMIYTPSEMVGAQRTAKLGMADDEKWTICTFMLRFTRLSLGFSKKLENLENAVALFLAYYNFCWRPGTMRVSPAMAAESA